ncbi:hypothetical protein JV46_14050 [Solemya velum gill symbiont]|uniref:Uncharacterized protein n=1 Tax=Solemya velum gill symbiont TaxID=2340 RepID=A0A0B0HDP4_SOVGS|nr:hypothetical protein [Solemya velum gill symbiont]KHF26039.1 hypothetical protein JV46_14050 [Solemya velum gill symbiont]
MTNYICGLIAIVISSLFIGGLAYSIWDNTESIAFPVIAILVLLMIYRSSYDEIKDGPDNV